MNKRRAAAEIGLLKALVLAIGVASGARAGISYLPLTGPPALRTLVVRTPKPIVVVKTETVAPTTTNGDNCPPITIKADDTNAADVEYSASSGNNFMTGVPMVPFNAGIPLDGAQGFAMPQQQLIGLTPEMLTTYFQPTVNGTNTVLVAAPFPVGFIPPFAEPDKSSHAEYIVK